MRDGEEEGGRNAVKRGMKMSQGVNEVIKRE